jgi:two-component system, chemotaxis family, protein-glutamate methylesterase/glutaminase
VRLALPALSALPASSRPSVPLPPPWDVAAMPASARVGAPLPRAAAGSGVDLLVLGASAGGPAAVERVLADLGDRLGVPVVVAQHMPAGFTAGFAQRLDANLALPVREARHHECLRAGVVYIAPGGHDLRIERDGGMLRAALDAAAAGTHICPSVDALFRSAAKATGGRLAAVVLSGMGSDGAAAMAQLASAGVATIAQDGATSAIFGMPRAAILAGGAGEVLPLQEIGPRLLALLSASSYPPGARSCPTRSTSSSCWNGLRR